MRTAWQRTGDPHRESTNQTGNIKCISDLAYLTRPVPFEHLREGQDLLASIGYGLGWLLKEVH
jgi:hypothetical protein